MLLLMSYMNWHVAVNSTPHWEHVFHVVLFTVCGDDARSEAVVTLLLEKGANATAANTTPLH
jgi:hypothetical protein